MVSKKLITELQTCKLLLEYFFPYRWLKFILFLMDEFSVEFYKNTTIGNLRFG